MEEYNSKLITILERIAVALEKIADNKNLVIQKKHNENNSKQNEILLDENKDATENKENYYENDIDPILRFLASKNIQVKNFKKEEEVDEVLDNIAIFMGNKYNKIKKIYNAIKSKLNTGDKFTLCLKDFPSEEISASCQLCLTLHKIAFLSEYKYEKSPHFIIEARPNRIPKAINFLTGEWLERFIKSEVKNGIRKLEKPLKFSYITNPQIVLPDGKDFELDVLFCIEDEIFWFEAKTGDYQNYVDKYSRVAKMMNLDNKHSFLVLTELDENSCIALKNIFRMEVVNIENFSKKFQSNIQYFNYLQLDEKD